MRYQPFQASGSGLPAIVALALIVAPVIRLPVSLRTTNIAAPNVWPAVACLAVSANPPESSRSALLGCGLGAGKAGGVVGTSDPAVGLDGVVGVEPTPEPPEEPPLLAPLPAGLAIVTVPIW